MTPSTSSALPTSKPFLSFSPSSRPLSPIHTRVIEVPPWTRSVTSITGPSRQPEDSVKPAVHHRFLLPSEARFQAPQTSTALLPRPPKAQVWILHRFDIVPCKDSGAVEIPFLQSCIVAPMCARLRCPALLCRLEPTPRRPRPQMKTRPRQSTWASIEAA